MQSRGLVTMTNARVAGEWFKGAVVAGLEDSDETCDKCTK